MKEKMLKIIEFRIDRLKETQSIIDANLEKFELSKIDNEARLDELESLLNYLKKQLE